MVIYDGNTVIPIIRCNNVSPCNLSIEVKLVALRQSPTKLCIKQGSIHLPWMCVCVCV